MKLKLFAIALLILSVLSILFSWESLYNLITIKTYGVESKAKVLGFIHDSTYTPPLTKLTLNYNYRGVSNTIIYTQREWNGKLSHEIGDILDIFVHEKNETFVIIKSDISLVAFKSFGFILFSLILGFSLLILSKKSVRSKSIFKF